MDKAIDADLEDVSEAKPIYWMITMWWELGRGFITVNHTKKSKVS